MTASLAVLSDVRAAISDVEFPPPPAEDVRQRWEAFYDDHGGEHAHERLQTLDAAAAARVHPNDRRRMVRALELAEAGATLAGDDLWSGETRVRVPSPPTLFSLHAK